MTKKDVLKAFLKRGRILTVFASLYFNLGDLKSADKCYQIYLKIIQKNYGDSSLELANSYFSIGVYFM